MKRKMLLLTLAIPVILGNSAIGQTASRLIASSNWANNGAIFTPVDSTYYSYSSGRGGDLQVGHILKYDNATMWNYLGDTAYSNGWYYIQTFDANNNITSRISQYWDGTAWVLYSKVLYTYNSSNQVTTMILQSWGGSTWVPVSQNVYTYNSAGKLVVDQYQTWNSLTMTFDASSQKTYYYDVSGNLVNETDQAYVMSTPVYTNQWAYTYSSTNQLLTTTYNVWDGSTWDPMTMLTNTYDSSGNMTNTLSQLYDAGTSTWVNNTLHIYSGFTASHKPTIDILQNWDGTGTGTWVNDMRFTYTYNSFDQLTSSMGESWNVVGVFEFALGDPLARYYYNTYTPGVSEVKAIANNGGDAKVYPVPAQNMLNVDLKWDNAQATDITMMDATGKTVRHWNTPAATEFHTSVSVDGLSEGVYFLKITGAQGQIAKQIVVAH